MVSQTACPTLGPAGRHRPRDSLVRDEQGPFNQQAQGPPCVEEDWARRPLVARPGQRPAGSLCSAALLWLPGSQALWPGLGVILPDHGFPGRPTGNYRWASPPFTPFPRGPTRTAQPPNCVLSLLVPVPTVSFTGSHHCLWGSLTAAEPYRSPFMLLKQFK